MPFSTTTEKHTEEYWTNHFNSFLKPLIEERLDLEAHRSEPLRGDVLRQIITELVVSPVVVADLTDRNPNVFWELGVRQSFKHCTVTVAEEGTKIPFDVSVKGILYYYPKDHIKNAKFGEQFKRAIRDCLSHPDSPDSHVLQTISGRGTLFEIIRRYEVIRRVKALISECEKNTRTYKAIYKTAERNQKESEERDIPTTRFRSPTLESLIVTRYLDEKDSFYKLAERCFDLILTRNEQLSLWDQSPEETEEWLLKPAVRSGIERSFGKYEKQLNDILQKLTSYAAL